MSELFTFEGFEKGDIEHFGIKGQKWGIRRYQNPDGSLTPLGEQRYGKRSKGRSGKKAKDKSSKRRKVRKDLKAGKLVDNRIPSKQRAESLKKILTIWGVTGAAGLAGIGAVAAADTAIFKAKQKARQRREDELWEYMFNMGKKAKTTGPVWENVGGSWKDVSKVKLLK